MFKTNYQKIPRKEQTWYHGKEHRGLIKDKKERRDWEQKITTEMQRGATEKNIVVLSNTRRESWLREGKKITSERVNVVPRKRTSWSCQEHERASWLRVGNYHGKNKRGVTEKNIVVLSITRKSVVTERRKLPRKEETWCHGKENKNHIRPPGLGFMGFRI